MMGLQIFQSRSSLRSRKCYAWSRINLSSLRAAGMECLLDSLLTTNREAQVCFTVLILTWSLFPVIKGV